MLECSPKTKCLICQKEIDLWPKSFNKRFQKWYYHKNRVAKYCGDACAGLARRRRKIVKCEYCQKEMELVDCSTKRFCDNYCAGKVLQSCKVAKSWEKSSGWIANQILRKTRLPTPKQCKKLLPIIPNCKICGSPVLQEFRRNYCSQVCLDQYLTEFRIRDNKIHRKNKQDRYITRKKKLVYHKGGSCIRCGYNRSLRALTFHHIGPKKFTLDSRSLEQRTWDEILIEAEKCELLCFNCHMEEHDLHLDKAPNQ